jgi:hypothetical protein
VDGFEALPHRYLSSADSWSARRFHGADHSVTSGVDVIEGLIDLTAPFARR